MTSQIGYLKLLITRSILSSPLDFEIKRVACIHYKDCKSEPCVHFVKFQPLVQDTVCTQAFFYQNLSFKVPGDLDLIFKVIKTL